MTQRRPLTTTRGKLRGIGLLAVAAGGLQLGVARPTPSVEALVRADTTEAAAAAVRAHGGRVTNALDVVAGVVASVDAGRVDELRADPAVAAVDLDVAVAASQSLITGTTYDTETQVGSMYSTARLVGADKLWAQGLNGSGVGVAVIDSGVQKSSFFGARLVAGADFSGANDALADGYGHGTHMAGIIGGSQGSIGAANAFTGIAPRAKVISVRVADDNGATSLLKILQGMDWVYRNRLLQNIKVANLSLGVPAYADYTRDPLVAASQRLWLGGVTVVASAGNIGPGLNLTSPAIDPMVIAAGAIDTKGTLSTADDAVAAFSAGARTASDRTPTVVVPARSIQSLVATGSLMAKLAPLSGIGTSYIRGTGTSQAAAVVSGEVALMYSLNPLLGPDAIKNELCDFASRPEQWNRKVAGCGQSNIGSMNLLNLSILAPLNLNPLSVVSAIEDAAGDLTARVSGQQSVSWQGVSWQGSSWQGSSWQGLPY